MRCVDHGRGDHLAAEHSGATRRPPAAATTGKGGQDGPHPVHNDPLPERIINLFGHVIADHELNPALSRAFVKEVMFVGELEREGVNEFMEGWSKRLTNVLREAQACGELSTRVRATVLGVNLYALFFYLLQCRYGGYLKPADLIARLSEGVELQLRPFMT